MGPKMRLTSAVEELTAMLELADIKDVSPVALRNAAFKVQSFLLQCLQVCNHPLLYVLLKVEL